MTKKTELTAKLNVWQRLGIVLSTLILFIAPAAIWLDIANRASETAFNGYRQCMDKVYDNEFGTASKCSELWLGRDNPDFWSLYSESFLLIAAALLIAWLLAYAATYTARWILAGRK